MKFQTDFKCEGLTENSFYVAALIYIQASYKKAL